MNGKTADEQARAFLRVVVQEGGDPPADVAPGDCGPWADAVATLINAHAEGKAPGVFEALVKADPGLQDLVEADAPAPLPVAAKRAQSEKADRLVAEYGLRTDTGNADRLVAEYGDRLRYCHAWGSWLAWNGQRWRRDDDGTLGRFAKAVARGIYREAANAYAMANAATSKEEVERWTALGAAWAKHATSSLSQHRLRALLENARVELPVLPAELDADQWALNVKNGILDLRTGELRPHDPQAFMTKLVPVVYDPDATLPLWDRFLTEATGGDVDLAAWLQKAVGYSLTGSTAEEVLFFVHGKAATGKSTFLGAIRATLGDYARTADFETFLQRRDVGGPRPDIARLAGARFVPSIEVSQGKRLAEGLVQLVTGGDVVTVRELYSKEFEYHPAFKLWLAANDAPRMEPGNDALWRRIRRVPFKAVIPTDRQDPEVKAVLGDPDVAGAAILAWAMRGCVAWQRDRLGQCPVVRQATAELRASMDPLLDFLAQCCVLDAEAWTSTAELRAAYETWCREGGATPVGGRRWSARLRANGCTAARQYAGGRQVRGWAGVGLLDSTQDSKTL